MLAIKQSDVVRHRRRSGNEFYVIPNHSVVTSGYLEAAVTVVAEGAA